MSDAFGAIAGAVLLFGGVGLFVFLIVAFRALVGTASGGPDAQDREVEGMFGHGLHGIDLQPTEGGDPISPGDR